MVPWLVPPMGLLPRESLRAGPPCRTMRLTGLRTAALGFRKRPQVGPAISVFGYCRGTTTRSLFGKRPRGIGI